MKKNNQITIRIAIVVLAVVAIVCCYITTGRPLLAKEVIEVEKEIPVTVPVYIYSEETEQREEKQLEESINREEIRNEKREHYDKDGCGIICAIIIIIAAFPLAFYVYSLISDYMMDRRARS